MIRSAVFIVLLVIAGSTVVAATWLGARQFGLLQVPLYLSALAVLAVAVEFAYRTFLPHHEPREDAGELVASDPVVLLRQRLVEVERRERDLADRLAGYQTLFEFPPPIDVDVSASAPAEPFERDRRLEELLERKTQLLFEKISANGYVVDGAFQPVIVRDDLRDLIREIARLYGRDADRVLSGISFERALRAASRCSLKLLGEIQQLPLDLPRRDLADLYDYLRQAVRVYGVYRAATPYFGPLRSVYYATRAAMGVNPFTLGAWWLAGRLGRKGATVLARRLANRWAINFLHDIVRVIGHEVAAVYDPHLRYRDPNWCYAAELTEMLHALPHSETALRQALSQIGALRLRNEYDRIFFFRCLAEGRSAGPERGSAHYFHPEQRRELANLLESFVNSHYADLPPKDLARWQSAVEDRLDIPLTQDKDFVWPALPEQRASALRSLAGYLLEIKQIDLDEVEILLAGSALASELPETERDQFHDSLRQDPPFFHEAPHVEPETALAKRYVDSLVHLTVAVPPRYREADEVAVATAVHLHIPAARIRERLDRAYLDQVVARLAADAPRKKFPAAVARAVLNLVEDGTALRFIYGVAVVGSSEPSRSAAPADPAWLVGIGDRLVCLQAELTPRILWEGDSTATLDRLPGVQESRHIRGGRWLVAADDSATGSLIVKAPLFKGRASYFAPLDRFFDAEW